MLEGEPRRTSFGVSVPQETVSPRGRFAATATVTLVQERLTRGNVSVKRVFVLT